jgi:hypothetical protein
MIVRLWRARPEDQWPETDRAAFQRASVGWKTSARIKGARTAFGQLLAFCAMERCLADRPGVERFHATVRARLQPEPARTRLRGLADALLALRPADGEGWAWLLEANRVLLRQIRGYGQKPRYKVKPRLRVPFEAWPEAHRQRWTVGLTPPPAAHFADRYGAEAIRAAQQEKGRKRTRLHPSQWQPASVAKAERGWGMWLWWTRSQEPAADPDEITPERVARCIGWHARRTRQTRAGVKHCAPMSLFNYAQELHMAVRVHQPEKDWRWLRRDVDALAEVAHSVRDKLSKLVPLAVLYLFGEALADRAARHPPSVWTAVEERDGVLIAMLALMPKRIGDFGEIRIGTNLILDEHGDPVALKFGRTKNGEPSETPIPKRLRPLLRRFLEGSHRLLNPHGSDCLWLSERGEPLTFGGINAALKKRTLEEKRIGIGINTHAFRMIYATSIGSFDPDALPAGSWMLDQKDERTITEHYSPICETAYASGKLDARTSALVIHPPRRKIRRRGPKKREPQGGEAEAASSIRSE